MNPTVTITADGRGNGFRLPTVAARAMGLASGRRLALSFGGRSRPAVVEADSRLADGEARLPRRIMEELRLPDYPQYELALLGGELRIGPAIGLLVSRGAADLTPERLNRLQRWLWDYPRLHGAVIVFSLENVDRAGRLVEGFCYHPGKKQFEPGVFPYPAVIYRTIGLSRRWKDHFLSALEGGFFNCPYFNKWDMYRWFAGDPVIGGHIPATVRYESPRQAEEMLRRCGALYIKPITGLGGHGIARAGLAGNIVRFEYRLGEQNRRDRLHLGPEAEAWFGARCSGGRFLLQQALDLIRIGGRVADFRCVMQKDPAGRWECPAVIGRLGKRGSVVSNITSGGSAFPAEELRHMEAALPKSEREQMPARLREFALTVCHALDRAGLRCGTLGLDVGIDSGGFLWLIEINNRDPDPTIALDIGDRGLYRRLKSGPLFYAKALAGFPASPEPADRTDM